MQLTIPGVQGDGEVYLDILKGICGDTAGKSMIDLMCHHAPYTPQLGFDKRTYVDIQDRGLDHKEEQQYFIQEDVIRYLYGNPKPKADVMICSDGIEHLPKATAWDIVLTMRQQSKKSIIFTPLGDCSISEGGHPDEHKSGWLPEEFLDMGYATIVFPNFHPSLNTGAFFAWHSVYIEKDYERVINELINKLWVK